jgi:predicted PurR-regulated permease PerM
MKRVLSDPVIKFFISVIGLVVIFTVLRDLQHIFIPFVIAYFLYFVFEPINKFLQNYKIPSALTIVIDLVIIIGIIWGISGVIISSFSEFGEELPVYEQKLNNIISSSAASLGITDPFFAQFNLTSIFSDIDYGGLASGFFSSTLSLFSTLFFVLFFFIFVSSGHSRVLVAIKNRYVERTVKSSLKKIKRDLKTHKEQTDIDTGTDDELEKIKSERTVLIDDTFKDITSKIQGYISTKFLMSFITGILVGIILWLFDVDYFIVWAVLTFLLNFIPNIGSVIAVILPTLMALVQYESFGYALIIAAIIVAVQNIIGNLIEPKIMGDTLGLNPLVILLSLLLWGYIWGIVGMFLSVPLTAVAKIIMTSSKSKNIKFLSDLMGN